LRFFLGYVVDLTLVLDRLFMVTSTIGQTTGLKLDDINSALENYKTSTAAKVHSDIRKYVEETIAKQMPQCSGAQSEDQEVVGQTLAESKSPQKRDPET
jgi:hypothetical protein